MPISAGSVRAGIFSPAMVRILPFAVFMAFVIASSLLPAPALIQSGWDPRLLYVARTVVVAALLLVFWRHYVELAITQLRQCQLLEPVTAGFVVFVLWIALDQPWAQIGDPVMFDPHDSAGNIDWSLVLPRLIGLALVVPVMEELFWRSYIQRWIDQPDFLNFDPKSGSWRALVIGSILFALEHNLLIAGFLAGLIYGWLYMRSGNLWSPVIAHAVTNSVLGFWILATGSWHLW